MATMRTPIESGVPDNKQYLHPLMLKNYGNWKYHDRPRPGVLHHVSHTGDEIWTVRAGTQRQMDLYTIRKLCDIADTYADGHVRFTIRSNIEYMVSNAGRVAPLIEALTSNGFPVGGTGNSVSSIAHTQGWLHCDIPGTDASGAVKALMDDLHAEFIKEEMPNRVHLSTSCCEINCGGQADIAIVIQHTKPPKINHDLVANMCERPTVVARCPVAAIRPALVNGKPGIAIDIVKVQGGNTIEIDYVYTLSESPTDARIWTVYSHNKRPVTRVLSLHKNKDGWTITTADGKPSAHFEHDVALVNGKPELLSTFAYIYQALGIESNEENEFRKNPLVL